MPEPTYEELKAKLAAIEAANNKPLTFKVSDKGGVSVYGLGRFPVTLYYEQWVKLLDNTADLKTFIELNKPHLKMKEA